MPRPDVLPPSVLHRPYIPVEGVIPDALRGKKYTNLSVAVDWHTEEIEQISDSSLQNLQQRIASWYEQKIDGTGKPREDIGAVIAIGEHTEGIIEHSLLPVIHWQLFKERTLAGKMMTSRTSYPLIGWNPLKLENFSYSLLGWVASGQIAEAVPEPHIAWPEKDLRSYVANAEKLPSEVKIVYFDNPPTRGPLLTSAQIAAFARVNPDVLLIIDQGNIGFAKTKEEQAAYDVSINKSLFTSKDSDDPLVFVVETATKAAGRRGLATLTALTTRTEDLFKEAYQKLFSIPDINVPLLAIDRNTTSYVNFVQEANRTAEQLVSQDSERKRAQIASHRHAIAELLQQHFPNSLPFGEGVNPHLIVNANALRFTTGDEMVNWFAKGENSFAVKTCIYYATEEADPTAKNDVFIAIPYDEKQQEALINRFARIRR